MAVIFCEKCDQFVDDDYSPCTDIAGMFICESCMCEMPEGIEEYEFTRRYKDGQPDSWVAVHRDYDGAPIDSFGPPADDRCFFGPNTWDVIEQIGEHNA